MESTLKLPFSNVQLELLNLFADNVPEEDLLEIKKMLVTWRFKKMREAADKAWDDKGYTPEDMERLLKTHLRKPYKSQKEYRAKRKSSKA